MYVDDFVYFLSDPAVEKAFEQQVSSYTTVDFMGQVSHFIGIKFEWTRHDEHKISVHLSQPAFTENLIQMAGLDHASSTTKPTPYRSGLPVDSVPEIKMSPHARTNLQHVYRSIVGSLQWLSSGTRPDIAVITNILAKYQNKPSPGHLDSAKHVIKYLKGTQDLGISFHSDVDTTLSSFLHFPLQSFKLAGVSDANWGPQDQSINNIPHKQKLSLFKTRSISGHLLILNGPLHWSAKRQKITARSSAEAEIYATDECCKDILRTQHIIQDLNLEHIFLAPSTPLYNDNMACVQWSHNKTSKGIRHIQIRENAVRESVQNGTILVLHVAGKNNLADIFTKEDKDTSHYISIRDALMSQPPGLTKVLKVRFDLLQSPQ
jgi:hypothetical protein